MREDSGQPAGGPVSSGLSVGFGDAPRLLARAVHPLLTDRLATERRALDDLARPLRRGSSLAVLGLQPGAGRTTVAGLLAHLLAVLGSTRVLAIDADTTGPGLRERLGAGPAGSLHAVFAGLRLEPPGRMRLPSGPPSFRWVSQHLAGDGRLGVLAAAANERGRPLPAAYYVATVGRFGRWYRAIVTDTPAARTADVLPGVIASAHRIVVVGTPDGPGLGELRRTLDFLASAGAHSPTICVLVAGRGDARPSLRRARATLGRAVHVLPFDAHLAAQEPLDWTALSGQTRRAAFGLACASVAGLAERVGQEPPG